MATRGRELGTGCEFIWQTRFEKLMLLLPRHASLIQDICLNKRDLFLFQVNNDLTSLLHLRGLRCCCAYLLHWNEATLSRNEFERRKFAMAATIPTFKHSHTHTHNLTDTWPLLHLRNPGTQFEDNQSTNSSAFPSVSRNITQPLWMINPLYTGFVSVFRQCQCLSGLFLRIIEVKHSGGISHPASISLETILLDFKFLFIQWILD